VTTNQIRDQRRPDSRPRRVDSQVLASHLRIPAIIVLLRPVSCASALTITAVSRS